jgi:protocatechuate 3,4-dioxygenase beta subunit
LERYLIVARRHGRATAVGALGDRQNWIDLELPVAIPVKGTVMDEQGNPVAGALVRCNYNAWISVPEGAQSARTNARGEFEIDDVGRLESCTVEHPGYARETLVGSKIRLPNLWATSRQIDVKLPKEGIVEGRVVDSETGQPAGGLLLDLQGIRGQSDGARLFRAWAKTDDKGRYRFGSIPPGKFNVFVASELRGRAAAALDSLEVRSDQAVKAPPIRLVKGSVVKGRLKYGNGKPARVGKNEEVSIWAKGPGRPASGPAVQEVQVRTDGTFEMRLPPGKNYVYLPAGGTFSAIKPGGNASSRDIREIDVREGQEYKIDFRVIRNGAFWMNRRS